MPVDVTVVDDIKLMVQSTIDFYGKIDILFNNAGFGRLNWLEKLGYERDIQTQIGVNLTGLIEVTRSVLPHMIENGSGHIINMASVSSWIASPLYSVYAATKFGVRGFTDALRREVRHRGIRVSGIYPGPAVTEFGSHISKGATPQVMLVPEWLFMPSEFVAEKVVQIAKRPRRRLILPWWFGIVIWLNNHCPLVSDWIQSQITKKYRK